MTTSNKSISGKSGQKSQPADGSADKQSTAAKTNSNSKTSTKTAQSAEIDQKPQNQTAETQNKTSNHNQESVYNTQEDTMSAQTSSKSGNKAGNQFETFANEAANAQQQSVQAFQQFQASFMRGCEDIMKTYTSILQDTGERNAEAVKTLLSCKTLDEYSQAQNKLWQENFDKLMSNATKLSEASIRVASQCMEPINEQFTTAVQRAGESLAA